MPPRTEFRVADVYETDHNLSFTAEPDAPFIKVVHAFASRADLRCVFLVQGERLVGVTTRTDMLGWASNHLGVPLRTEDRLADALNLMCGDDMIDLPVVDAQGRIQGDRRLSEILAKVLLTYGG